MPHKRPQARYFFLADKFQGSTNRTVNEAGYLVVKDCSLARSGILYYRASDIGFEEKGTNPGDLIAVYRPPAEVEKIVDKYSNMPITLTHPEDLEVRPETARGLQVGHIGSSCTVKETQDGEVEIIADVITITDKETIDNIQKGSKEELSVGYRSRCRAESGVAPDGTAYKAVQYDLVPNHVAVVEQGRCGTGCRVADEAVKQNQTKETSMEKVVIEVGGQRFTISSELAEALAAEGVTEEGAAGAAGGSDLEGAPAGEGEGLIPGDEPGGEEAEIETEEEEVPGDDEMPPELAEALKEKGDKPVGDTLFKIQLPNGKTAVADAATIACLNEALNKTPKQKEAATVDHMETAKIINAASRILGDSFDIDKFASIGAVKVAVVKAALPMVDAAELRDPAKLETLYRVAVKTVDGKAQAFGKDLSHLTGDAATGGVVAALTASLGMAPAPAKPAVDGKDANGKPVKTDPYKGRTLKFVNNAKK